MGRKNRSESPLDSLPFQTTMEELKRYLAEKKRLIDATLDRFLPPGETPPKVIHEAMRYSVMAGGKRIRPVLAVAAAEACGAETTPLLRHFAALELIHTYSLVHDDLPALDNDDLRRGLKTSHVVFGEAMAILAGDALLTEAFSWLAVPVEGIESDRQLEAIATVARAVDSRGMIGGQVADLEAEKRTPGSSPPDETLRLLHFIHANKTGKLLTASVLLGGILGGAEAGQLAALRDYGESVGLAFQIVDDLLDLEESAETLGKTAGKDAAQGKLTYPALLGVERSREEIPRLLERAQASAGMIGGSVNYLAEIARYICVRRS